MSTVRQRAAKRLSAAEYKALEAKRTEQEAKEADEWTEAADADGSAEIILLYFGIATIVFGMLGLWYARSMYLDMQQEPQEPQQEQ